MERCSIRSIGRIIGGLCVLLVAGCMAGPSGERHQPFAVRTLVEQELPDFSDDLQPGSLRTAVQRSLDYFRRVPAQRSFPLGDQTVTAGRIRDSLSLLLELADAGRLTRKEVARKFRVYRVERRHQQPDPVHVLVTGYYEPILGARLAPDDRFQYPIYAVPPDLVTVDLGRFKPDRLAGERVVGRVVDGRLQPYFTRAEIDGRNKLLQCACQLAWLSDPIDRFFLHVQGSGVLETETGERLRIGYAGGNGRPYRSIGKYLIETGEISRETMSLQAIRAYLRDHPERLNEVLWYNESYVFFRWVDQGPMGSLNVPLVAGRSVATDAAVYPKGAPGFLVTTRPVLDADGTMRKWVPFERWVVNQDTGGAIKGPDRVDLFCGTGPDAEQVAGRLKQPGSFYLVLKKQSWEKPSGPAANR